MVNSVYLKLICLNQLIDEISIKLYNTDNTHTHQHLWIQEMLATGVNGALVGRWYSRCNGFIFATETAINNKNTAEFIHCSVDCNIAPYVNSRMQ